MEQAKSQKAKADNPQTELRFEAFTDIYSKIKGFTASMTIDENNKVRIVNEEGAEIEAYEFQSAVEIQKFFDLAGEVFRHQFPEE